MCKTEIDERSGFCFGVVNAIKKAEELLADGSTLYCLGDIVHNSIEVERLKALGLITINHEEFERLHNVKVLLRAHGEPPETYYIAKKNNIEIIDATCPFVKKIHEIVREYYENNYKIIIVGDKNHAEVKGIAGWCNNDAIYIKNYDTLNNIDFNIDDKYCLVSQTTMNEIIFNKIMDKINSLNLNIEIKNTICSATSVRQKAARNLAKNVDLMIVIGGKHSSNTQKLVKICENEVNTKAIEVADELNQKELIKNNKIGITAGASTPDWIIEEVISKIKAIKSDL